MLPPDDREVVEQLVKAGDDRRIARPVIHWFFGEEEDLCAIAKFLGGIGWTNVDPRQDEDGWLSSPTKHTDLSDGSIVKMNSEIEAALGELGVTYDGWETSVEKGPGLLSRLFGKPN